MLGVLDMNAATQTGALTTQSVLSAVELPSFAEDVAKHILQDLIVLKRILVLNKEVHCQTYNKIIMDLCRKV